MHEVRSTPIQASYVKGLQISSAVKMQPPRYTILWVLPAEGVLAMIAHFRTFKRARVKPKTCHSLRQPDLRRGRYNSPCLQG
ncbi:hypothetical protein ASE82_18690 [Sphingomonas sp. Leaf230]|nr:hypothetical protein ASE82_18690 [Sphingomonas sp. Leaf230]